MKAKKKIRPDLPTLMPELIQVWRRYIKLSGPQDCLQTREFRAVVDDIKALEAAFTAGKTPEYTREIIGSYLLYYFPLHFAQGISIINELPEVPQRVLEIASGSAPFAMAALKHGATDVYALDRNEDALRLGSEAVGRQGFPISLRRWEYPRNPFPVDGTFDLIILPYCMDELFESSSEKENRFIEECLHRLNDTGHLLIVDKSETLQNTRILKLRDHFVSKGIAIQAPCVWKGECPALKSNSPCFAQREFEKPDLMKEIQRGANIFLSSLKMSYLVLKSPKASWPVLPTNEDFYRVVSPPLETQGGIMRYYLCGTTGKKQLFEERGKSLNLRRGSLITMNPEELGETLKHVIKAPGEALSKYEHRKDTDDVS